MLIQQIRLALHIDYSRPVAGIQKELESLRMLHVRSIQWTLPGSASTLDTAPDCRPRGILGDRRLQSTRSHISARQLLFGLAIIPPAIWLSKKFGNRMSRLPIIQRLMKDLAGYNLNAASAFLATLSEFADEKRGS